ncbi:serine/threonine protein kinase [Waterburya agarophytonicola K14]|uniref:non-specific serine/threonine protein kinase n=1 Tax=Waterburya agarophytonicola KI4 TaxID=2874699 RepID=A0A964FFK2_9CYAN|nr:serine/threonine-protein kinase [Waterburya agarophytonicola]MCC0177880.1 serine/threonine protein kinase [Waterburya agarophytonicola KI4]
MIGETLNGRYHVLSLLGTGKYGQTYLAEDRQAKGNLRCVIKQFEPQAKDTLSLRKAKYLFAREAKILKILGKSDRIPNLLGYFRNGDKFYLVHEFIEGTDLAQELGADRQWTAEQVVGLLRQILEIVEVAHQEKVIHQDIKPSNIIRRESDGKLMLIDFGSVKKLNNQMANAEGKTSLTVPIGTEGYMAPEQKSIKPKLASDVYGVGMIGIYALTGVEPKDIPLDHDTEVVKWKDGIQVNENLAEVLDRMVSPDFRQRYTSASEALKIVRNFKLGRKLKLFDFKTIFGTGIVLLGILGAGYYYWQLENSLNQIPKTADYDTTNKDKFPFLYSNSEYGIEMKYPSSWKLKEANQPGSVIAQFIPERSQSYLIPPEVEIRVDQQNANSLDEYTTNAVYQITRLPQAKIIDSRPIKLSEKDGHKVIYTKVNPENKIETKHLQIWTLNSDRVYLVSYEAELGQYDNFEAIVEDEMLESLKIMSTK